MEPYFATSNLLVVNGSVCYDENTSYSAQARETFTPDLYSLVKQIVLASPVSCLLGASGL